MHSRLPPTQMSESFRMGALLAVTGGFFDVYTYLCRGKVFANAQTGNMVLLGISVSQGQWLAALQYLLPITAFAIGIAMAEWLKAKPHGRYIHWRQTVLLLEMLLVIVAAFLPQRANVAVNILVSFICALQVEAFRKVRGSAFATTMCTGNLRSATEQMMRWHFDKDPAALSRALRYFAVIAYFSLGAALGTAFSLWLHEKAILLSCLPLGTAFLLMFHEKTK